MSALETAQHRPPIRQHLRIGCVSFLNAKPLIDGLENSAGLDLTLDVPSRLLAGLQRHRFDVALLPVIDYQRMEGLRLLCAGGIGCDGPTLTVRIFSPIPVSEICTLACDSDSHTSVALAKIILAERYGIQPRIIDFDFHADANGGEHTSSETAQLLIGDKVVCQEPKNLPHQIDLGQAWKELTGLPFLFAAWMARGGIELGDLPTELAEAKRRGLRHVEQIIARDAIPTGWPAEVARKYLTEYLQFDIGPKHLQAVRLFHRLAHQHGVIDHPPRELDVIGEN
ncbi:MAG TPA: menaquinone biosynthesis protein [Tepidisphaeraceae bacterium]|jgi:chorismate dehydratase|nr:menaquinone biosynthesis protein [Tepidisphaeraceae bacterium]